MMQPKVEQFAVAHLWAAMADIPAIYGVKAAKGALNALKSEIERLEADAPPLFEGTRAERIDALRSAMPALCAECPLR